ncbi:MAG: hemerythrin family protein [Fimbriimonadales bacterium]|nr:hemerythrin family protein [Fimbriimonadales bacterium]
MGDLTWNDALAVGDVEVDGQHRVLIDLLHRILRLAAEPDPKASEAAEAVHAITTYSRLHFETEEELWMRRAPQHYSRHRRLHDDFRRRASELEQTLREGRPIDLTMVAAELQAWILNHLMLEDQLLKRG